MIGYELDVQPNLEMGLDTKNPIILVSLAPGFLILPRLFGTSRGFPEESKNLARRRSNGERKKQTFLEKSRWRTGKLHKTGTFSNRNLPCILYHFHDIWLYLLISRGCRGCTVDSQLLLLQGIDSCHLKAAPSFFGPSKQCDLSAVFWTNFFQKNNLNKKLSMSELFDPASVVFLSQKNKTLSWQLFGSKCLQVGGWKKDIQ